MISRYLHCALLFGVAVFAASSARSAIKISSKPTENVTCTGGVCTATAKNAVLNVQDLAQMLSAGDIAVASGSVAKDIEIDAALSWTSSNRLTLDAYHGITFNNPVAVAGTGALTITTNNGGRNGDFRFFGKGHVEFWDLSSKLIVNGNQYTLVKTIDDIKNCVRRGRSIYCALAKHLDLGKHTFGKSPIGAWLATFEGLGNTISNLTIVSSSSCLGLFGQLQFNGDPSTIRDIGLTSVKIQGTGSEQGIGALVCSSVFGTIENAYVSGQISGGDSSVVGGLVGYATGAVSNSYSVATVSGGNNATAAGGLVGYLDGECDRGCAGTIDLSYAAGPVTGGDDATVGGLVGYNFGGMITNSYATGAASGGNDAFVGGLLGSSIDSDNPPSHPIVARSYSTGAVSGGAGAVTGGLIGQDASDLQNTDVYWDLDTSGIGDPSRGAGNVQNDPGITGLTDAQLKSGLPAGFSPSVWKEKTGINSGYPYLADNLPSQ